MIYKNYLIIVRFKRKTHRPFCKKTKLYNVIFYGGDLESSKRLQYLDRLSSICKEKKICLRVLRRRSHFFYSILPINAYLNFIWGLVKNISYRKFLATLQIYEVGKCYITILA